MAKILDVKNLFKVYNVKSENVVVLRNINLEMEDGEFLILFGPSGCGKSTLLNTILGLEVISSGNVNLLGKQVSNLSQDELADIRKNNVGIVYQQPNWVKSLNVLENVAFPLLIKGVKREIAYKKAKEKLELVGMFNWKDYFPMDLSSGQQQKVALARALINDPKVLIADEPTGNLDYRSSMALMAIFRDLSNTGISILLVTHNLVNLDYADRVARMFDGEIVEFIDAKKISEKKLNEMLHPTESASSNNYKLSFNINKARKFNLLDDLIKSLLLPLLLIKTVVLLVLFSVYKFFGLFSSLGLGTIFNPITKGLDAIIDFIDKRQLNSIRFSDVADVSLKTLFTHRVRTIVTIGGVAVGVSFTVLLFSIGFGFEQVVISRIANLDELNQVDVAPLPTSNVFITTQSVENLKTIDSVNTVLPIIGIAGKTNFDGALADVVVKGVTSEYFEDTGLKITQGEKFTPTEDQLQFQNLDEIVANYKKANNIEDEVLGDVVLDLPIKERQAVVNESVLRVFNLSKEDAIGKKFKIKFIATNSLIGNNYKISSSDTEYTIVGVVSLKEEKNIYIPAEDLLPLGVQRYSEAKIIVSNIDNTRDVRVATEALGFRTRSIQDTISQVNAVFDNVRLIFAAVGIVALFIASLGMFNTLTVSLLERIREVGLMKAIGMKSYEVRSLFLAESTIMGFLGGFFGILLGIVLGIIFSSVISAWYISRGGEYVSLTFLPLEAALAILFISVLIGILTGYYPSVRATRISPLEALRHE